MRLNSAPWRYAGYLVSTEVSNVDLIESMKSAYGSSETEEKKMERFREKQRIRDSIVNLRPDPNDTELDYTKKEIKNLKLTLKNAFQKQMDISRRPPDKTISVINPCRSFKIGANIEIAKFADQIVLQQELPKGSDVERNNQWEDIKKKYIASGKWREK